MKYKDVKNYILTTLKFQKIKWPPEAEGYFHNLIRYLEAFEGLISRIQTCLALFANMSTNLRRSLENLPLVILGTLRPPKIFLTHFKELNLFFCIYLQLFF